jgi:hypothetical protein
MSNQLENLFNRHTKLVIEARKRKEAAEALFLGTTAPVANLGTPCACCGEPEPEWIGEIRRKDSVPTR